MNVVHHITQHQSRLFSHTLHQLRHFNQSESLLYLRWRRNTIFTSIHISNPFDTSIVKPARVTEGWLKLLRLANRLRLRRHGNLWTVQTVILVTGFFFHLYTGNIEKILKYCQDHGVILSSRACPHCNSVCRLDYRCKYFRCDKSVSGDHKKRRRCNFKVSVFKNTWFDKSHLDVETNLFFF